METIDITLSQITWKRITNKEGSPTAIAMQALLLQLESHKSVYFVEGFVVNDQTKLLIRHTWIEADNRIIDPLGFANWSNEFSTNRYFPSFKINYRELQRYMFNTREPLHKQHKGLAERMARAEQALVH